ncbi:MAG: methyltransferase domain-containing protein [Polyangia bacterium]
MGPTSPAPMPSSPLRGAPSRAGSPVSAGLPSGIPSGAPAGAPPLPPGSAAPPGRFRRDPRLAAAYDTELAPLWTQPFGRLLVAQLAGELGEQLGHLRRATILDVMCHTGDPALELVRRLPEARVFAVDPSSAMLDVARKKSGPYLSRRIFFRTEPVEPRLPFDESMADLVISNLGLHDVEQPPRLLREMARVAKPGARILATLPLRGTFAEFYALVENELRDEPHKAARLQAHLRGWPDAATVRAWAEAAGLQDLEVAVEPFTLLFAGGADLFFAPVIEYGPLVGWKGLLGDSLAEMQARFVALRDAIDRLCEGKDRGGPRRPFALTVRAACLRARCE